MLAHLISIQAANHPRPDRLRRDASDGGRPCSMNEVTHDAPGPLRQRVSPDFVALETDQAASSLSRYSHDAGISGHRQARDTTYAGQDAQ